MRQALKYPIGLQDFRKIREGGFIYVDKTALIKQLIDDESHYFLSRPRRFGKSLLLSTIAAYFRGEQDLFKGLAIEQHTAEWHKHPVLHLDLGGQTYTDAESLDRVLNASNSMNGYTVFFYREADESELVGLTSMRGHFFPHDPKHLIAKPHVSFESVYNEPTKVDGWHLNLAARAAKVALPKVFGKSARIEFERIGLEDAWGRVVGKNGEALSSALEFHVVAGRV